MAGKGTDLPSLFGVGSVVESGPCLFYHFVKRSLAWLSPKFDKTQMDS